MKKTNWLVVVLVTVATVLALSATPASAAYSNCTNGYACIFFNDNGGGAMYTYPGSQSGGTCTYVGASANDQANSFYNRDHKAVSFYQHHNCTGARTGPISPGGQGNMWVVVLVRNSWIDLDDDVSSIFFHTGS